MNTNQLPHCVYRLEYLPRYGKVTKTTGGFKHKEYVGGKAYEETECIGWQINIDKITLSFQDANNRIADIKKLFSNLPHKTKKMVDNGCIPIKTTLELPLSDVIGEEVICFKKLLIPLKIAEEREYKAEHVYLFLYDKTWQASFETPRFYAPTKTNSKGATCVAEIKVSMSQDEAEDSAEFFYLELEEFLLSNEYVIYE